MNKYIQEPEFFERARARRRELQEQYGHELTPADEMLQLAYDEKDDTELLKAIADGANPDVLSSDWVYPILTTAIEDGRPEVAELLLDAGADPMKWDYDLLWALCETGNARLLRRVLSDYDVLPIKDIADYIEHVIENGHLDCLRELRAAGVDLLAHDGRALCRACLANEHEIVDYLLNECGAELELEYDDWSPLFYAAQGNSMESARILLEAGADPTHEDIAGRTPMSWAASKQMLGLLQRYDRK